MPQGAIKVPHPGENQMFTSRPVADRVRGTAFRVDITDGPHTLVEDGAPTVSTVQNNARLDLALAALDAANARLAALEASAGIPVASAAPLAPSAPVAAPVAEPTVAELQAQLAEANAKLAAAGTAPYVAPTA
jgi:hypothetical protein